MLKSTPSDHLMNVNHSRSLPLDSLRAHSIKPLQQYRYRKQLPYVFLLLWECCEYFRIMRWSIPEGWLVNDVEPEYRLRGEMDRVKFVDSPLSLKTWSVSTTCLSPKGTVLRSFIPQKLFTFRVYWCHALYMCVDESEKTGEEHTGICECLILNIVVIK